MWEGRKTREEMEQTPAGRFFIIARVYNNGTDYERKVILSFFHDPEGVNLMKKILNAFGGEI